MVLGWEFFFFFSPEELTININDTIVCEVNFMLKREKLTLMTIQYMYINMKLSKTFKNVQKLKLQTL